MTRRTLVSFGLLLMAATGSAQQPARIVSPDVSADRRVTFRLAAPQAREILLTGEFMADSKPFEKDANGLWTLTIGPLEPEIYHYNVTIDGVRTIDPNNPDVKTGSTPSTISSILEVRGNQPAFYDAQTTEHGDVRSLRYKNHLELFSHVGGFSAAVGPAAAFPKTYASLVADGKSSNQKLRLLWVGCGKEDGLFGASKSFSEFLTQHHISHTFHESSGAHTWMVWRRYLNEIAPLLFQSGQ